MASNKVRKNIQGNRKSFPIKNVNFLKYYLVAVGGGNGVINVYDQHLNLKTSFQAHINSPINRIKQIPNGYVASTSNDKTVKIWNPLTNWTLIQTFTGHTSAVQGLEYICDEKIASGDLLYIIIWTISTGNTSMKINVSSYTQSLQLLSNGVHLAAGLQNGLINIYNLNDGSLISTLIGHTTSVFNLVLERDRDLLISSSGDTSTLIWNLKSNTLIFNLTGHTAGVRGLKLVSFDTFITGSGDGTLKLWNLTVGTLIKTLLGHSLAIEWSVDMLSDKQTIVSGSLDKTIKLWNLQTEKCLNTTSTGLAIWSLFVLNTTLTSSS